MIQETTWDQELSQAIVCFHRIKDAADQGKKEKKSVYSYRIDAGIFCLSPCGHRARMNSLSAETVVEGSYLLGPMSVPSKSRNLTSIGSFPPAISRPDRRPPPPTPQDPRNPGSEVHSTKQIARNPRGHAKDRVLMNNSCFRVGVESERAATRWERKRRRGGRKEGEKRRKTRRGHRHTGASFLGNLTDTPNEKPQLFFPLARRRRRRRSHPWLRPVKVRSRRGILCPRRWNQSSELHVGDGWFDRVNLPSRWRLLPCFSPAPLLLRLSSCAYIATLAAGFAGSGCTGTKDWFDSEQTHTHDAYF